VINKTIVFSPIGLAACSLVEVAFLGAHNASVTDCKLSETGKTVALIKAFTRLSRAGNAIYRSRKFKRKVTVNKWI
jgi:hypothetical protein